LSTVASAAVGIDALGVYVPSCFVVRADLAASWGAAGSSGRRAVADHDEDVITMAVAAGAAALRQIEDTVVDAVLFVTTSPIFTERQHAPIIAAALGVPGALCLDLGGSLRGGLDAVLVAESLVRSGRADRVLVVASDRRDLQPGSTHEQRSGDAAAAVVVASRPRLLEITGAVTQPDTTPSMWRSTEATGVSVGDERFVVRELLEPWLVGAIRTVSPPGVSVVALASPVANATKSSIRRCGAQQSEWSIRVADDVGFCGVAEPFIQLAGSLSLAAAGQSVIVAAAGDGATALSAQVIDAALASACSAAAADALEERRAITAGAFQRLRKQLPLADVEPFASDIALWRERDEIIGLLGARCRKCNRLQFPCRRICENCGALDSGDREPLPRTGVLYTYTTEYLFPNRVNSLQMCVVDLGECRFYTQLAGTPTGDWELGSPVELVLRVLHHGGGLPRYFWKATIRKSAHVPQ
jgi:3-hydroxy-3-methylglutaryl CoA synthase